MILPNISKNTCYYNIQSIGIVSRDPMRREFSSYYTSPGIGIGEIQEIDLPPLDGNNEPSDIIGAYTEKFVQKNGEYVEDANSNTTYEVPTLFNLTTVLWNFSDYTENTSTFPGDDFNFKAGTIENNEETFTVALKQDFWSYNITDDGIAFDTSMDPAAVYAFPFVMASPEPFGYGMNIGTTQSSVEGDQAPLSMEDVLKAIADDPEGAAGFLATSKENASFIEDYSFEYPTPYSKDALTKANIDGAAMDADVKFRYHYYLKDYEDAVNALPDINTSIAAIKFGKYKGLEIVFKDTGDRVEFILPNPYDYEYANFVLDNPYYSKVTAGGGDEKLNAFTDTTKNVINSIQVFEALYGADYVDFTSLAGTISFSLIKNATVVDYLRAWSKCVKGYQTLGFEDETSNKPSQVRKNRNRFLAESAHIEADGTLQTPTAPVAPDSLNSLLNNATFDYFNFNHPDIEKYFGDLDFTLRNSLDIGQKNTKLSQGGAAFPMSVEIKFKYPILSLFHPLAQRTKEWLPDKVTNNAAFGGALTLEKHGGLMQKIMAMNLADPFMRNVVSAIDLPSGGPTPINEESSDPTMMWGFLGSQDPNPNFVRQANILGKEAFGYRTNNVNLPSVLLDDAIEKMYLDISTSDSDASILVTDAMHRRSKTFFSDRAEDFFLPMDMFTDVGQLRLTVRDHKKIYEDTANKKNTRRDFKNILEGKKCFVETLFFGIEKYELTRNHRGKHDPINRGSSVQRFFVTPPPLTGNGSTDEYVRYVDTQVKYGKKYTYQTFAYVLVYGTQYRCNRIQQTTVAAGDWETGNWITDALLNSLGLPVPAFDLTYESKPSYRIFKIRYYGTDWEDKGGVFFPTHIKNNPPTAPYMNIVGYRNVNNQILINMQPSSGDVYQFPISIREDENSSYETDPSDIYFGNAPSGMVRFSADDRIKKYRIYRLDTAPQSYGDFRDAVSFEIDTSVGSSLKNTILPNTRYYYTAKAMDSHDQFSNPTPVLSVEIVDEKGLIYPVIEEYEIKVKDKKTRKKSGRKAIYIAPSLEQIKIKSNVDPENPELGMRDSSVFSKRFKVRLTSEKTNKMIDFNLRFSQINENKKMLDKENCLIKDTLPRYAVNNPEEYGWILDGPDFDLALAISLGIDETDVVPEDGALVPIVLETDDGPDAKAEEGVDAKVLGNKKFLF